MNKLWQFLRSPDFRKNLIYAVLFIAGLLVLVMVSLRIYTRQDDLIVVPDFQGMSQEQAERIAAGKFHTEIGTTVIENKKPGTVILQEPEPGDKVKPGRRIYLSVVAPERPKTLPDLTGVSRREAEAILESYGIAIKERIYRRDKARDIVLRVTESNGKEIIPGTELTKNDAVVLELGDGFGSEYVEVPDCQGLELDEAQMVIRSHSLLVGNIYYEENVRNRNKAVVYKLEPQAGDTVEYATAVNIYLQ